MNMNENSGPRITKQMLDSSFDASCEKCNSQQFSPIFFIKKISALMSPNGQEINMPIQTFACAKCGHVNEDFKPKANP